MMKEQWFSQWRHVFKLDPDKEISDAQLEQLCMSGTDAIIVGGSSGVTFENTVDLLSRIRRFSLDCALEVSTLDGAVPGFDGYFVPFVLNTKNADWIALQQLQGLQEYGSFVPWDVTAGSGYIILNGDSTAAKLSGADATLDGQSVLPYIWMSDRLWRLPLTYIEYSGTFGDMNVLRRIRDEVIHGQLFYGGGIDSAEKAKEAAQYADTIVVGNIVYTHLEQALATVEAVKSIQQA